MATDYKNPSGGYWYTPGGDFNAQPMYDIQNRFDAGQIDQPTYLSQIAPFVNKLQEVYPMFSAGSLAPGSGAGNQKIWNTVQNYNLLKMGQDMLGRPLTQSEVAQLAPAFQAGATSGRAALAQFAEAEKQKLPYLQIQAGKYAPQVNQIFQDLLKRGASQDEIQHFGSMLATGQTDPYELSQFVQSMPEYQTAADKSFRGDLASELQGYDTSFLKKAAPSVLSTYAKAGTQNSSALDYAMTDLMGKLAENRGNFLGTLSAQQYGGNKEAARQDYLTTQQNYLNSILGGKQRSQGLQDYYSQRGDQAADYSRQMNDYLSFLQNQPKQKSNPLAGAMMGAGAMAPTLNPWAIGAGGLAGMFAYMNQ